MVANGFYFHKVSVLSQGEIDSESLKNDGGVTTCYLAELLFCASFLL